MSKTPCKRYEIWMANLNPTQGSEIKKVRPVVIVSQNEMNRNLETIVICPLTSQLHPQWRSRLQVKVSGKRSEIAVDQIRTISRQRLKRKMSALSAIKASELRTLIVEMYGEA